jgi:hypothetical protein
MGKKSDKSGKKLPPLSIAQWNLLKLFVIFVPLWNSFSHTA